MENQHFNGNTHYFYGTLTDIAIENVPFIVDLPIKVVILGIPCGKR